MRFDLVAAFYILLTEKLTIFRLEATNVSSKIIFTFITIFTDLVKIHINMKHPCYFSFLLL